MPNRTIYRIFKRGSRTYFYNSIFFPKKTREDVFKLYSFVRKADNYVDTIPQQVDEFYAFRDRYYRARAGEITGDFVVDSFSDLVDRKDFEEQWVSSFLASMEMDITRKSYRDFEDLDTYIFGSAEVIGLFMAKVLDLNGESLPHARFLGKAMQYINFIRDIPEDTLLDRLYIPMTELEKHGLSSLQYDEVKDNISGFRELVRSQIDIYNGWQDYAEKGFKYVPRRLLIPIKNASEMYKWTGKIIRKDPLVVFKKKVKPSVPRIVLNIGYNTMTA
ncbi:MAG: phytoene/squalene synthase family protein [Thermoplasmata archaeon]|nr:MAG: phytoene/squalene synthase family protein [Thermoplasmata archaeon]